MQSPACPQEAMHRKMGMSRQSGRIGPKWAPTNSEFRKRGVLLVRQEADHRFETNPRLLAHDRDARMEP